LAGISAASSKRGIGGFGAARTLLPGLREAMGRVRELMDALLAARGLTAQEVFTRD